MTDPWHRVVTGGAPSPGDPRDGELHQVFDELSEHVDLEPWDDVPGGAYVRCWRTGRWRQGGGTGRRV